MKLKKTMASLLTMAVLFTVAFAQVPLTAIVNASPDVTITILTHYNEPEEMNYWDAVMAAYNALPAAQRAYSIVEMVRVDFDFLYDEIVLRHSPPTWEEKTDTDIIHMHSMWLADFANYVSEVLTVLPYDVQNEIKAVGAFSPTTVEAATYKGLVYGFPTEYNQWALVYNRALFEQDPDVADILTDLENDVPLSWADFEYAAHELTVWNPDNTINQTGFVPFVEGMPEEQRYQFLSLLWSNGGDYVDLTVPTTLFSNQSGYEVMQLYHRLGGYESPEDPPEDPYQSYDPLNQPDYWWSAWADETVAMMILPTWMTYVRGAMGENFAAHLGVAPIPIGPNGWRGSKSATYSWMMGVTEKAKKYGRMDEALAFIDWLFTPNAPGTPFTVPGVGDVPQYPGVTIMGDWLITDSVVPSKISDQVLDERLDDFWFSGFFDMGATYGKADKSFVGADEVQAEVGLMFEQVVLTGAIIDPVTAVDDAEVRIQPLLPMAGDINLADDILGYPVGVLDGDLIQFDAFDSLWATPDEWIISRGRSDITDNGEVDVFDATILGGNFGRHR